MVCCGSTENSYFLSFFCLHHDSCIILFMRGHWDLLTLSNVIWHALNTALLLKTQYWFAHTIFLSKVNETSRLPGLLCDLLWSDPDKDVRGWGENDRGVSFTFGPDIVTRFNNRHDIDLICRAHQVRGTRKAIEPHTGRQVVTVSFCLVCQKHSPFCFSLSSLAWYSTCPFVSRVCRLFVYCVCVVRLFVCSI